MGAHASGRSSFGPGPLTLFCALMRVKAPPRSLATAGFVDLKTLPKGPNGRALCRYCGQEVPVGRKSFCSGEKATFRRGQMVAGSGCVHEHCIRSQPGYARQCVWARDHGRCALCPKVCPRNDPDDPWQSDHIVPVIEGGGSCGLENLRTLCTACHRLETAKLAARRAEARRAAKAGVDGPHDV